MARPLGVWPGGIQSLLTLPSEQWEAIEADLLVRGFVRSQIGTRKLPWSAVAAMVKYTAHGSALWREIHGDAGRWSDTEQLLGNLNDWLALLAWLSSDTKKNKRPEPLKRPGAESASNDTAFGSAATAVPVDQFWELWNQQPDEAQPNDGDKGEVSDAG